jgi:hypothetical protein
LLGVLVMKEVLAPSEAKAIRGAGPGTEFQLLVEALSGKGLLNLADVSGAANPATQPSTPVTAALATPDTAPVSASSVQTQQPSVATTQQTPQREKPLPVGVVPAVAPVRVLPVDPPVKDGLVAAFRLGPVKMTPYGFLKATVVRDSSAPDGDDFPFIGLFFNSTALTNAGPNGSPAFHIKARSSRIGANFEWPDISPKLTMTGRVEADFESNFSVVDNADASSIRNPGPRLRLAYVRMDYQASDKTDLFSKADRIGRFSDRVPFPTSWRPRSWARSTATFIPALPNLLLVSCSLWAAPLATSRSCLNLAS